MGDSNRKSVKGQGPGHSLRLLNVGTSKMSLQGYASVRGEEGLGTFQQEDSAESKGPGGTVTILWVRRRGSGERGCQRDEKGLRQAQGHVIFRLYPDAHSKGAT